MVQDDTKIDVPLVRHPRYKVISRPGLTEYRYYKRSPEDSAWFTLWLDALVVSVLSYVYYQLTGNTRNIVISGLLLFLYVYSRCTGIVYETVLVLPPHGVQLETHRGPFGPLFASRKFIPSEHIHDIIINEALWRWNVRYYLAIVIEAPGRPHELAVAFENTLPHFPVLLQVYQGTKSALFKE